MNFPPPMAHVENEKVDSGLMDAPSGAFRTLDMVGIALVKLLIGLAGLFIGAILGFLIALFSGLIDFIC